MSRLIKNCVDWVVVKKEMDQGLSFERCMIEALK